MLAFLAALAAAAQPAPPPPAIGRTAWVYSMIDHSEFCPAGNVRLDLRTGRYELTNGASRRICNNRDLDRPMITGILPAPRLADIRGAYLHVLTEDVESQACREHRRPDYFIVNNGGTPILVVSTGAVTGSAPADLGCWSEAARFLQNLLDHQFGEEGRRR